MSVKYPTLDRQEIDMHRRGDFRNVSKFKRKLIYVNEWIYSYPKIHFSNFCILELFQHWIYQYKSYIIFKKIVSRHQCNRKRDESTFIDYQHETDSRHYWFHPLLSQVQVLFVNDHIPLWICVDWTDFEGTEEANTCS